MRCFYMDVAPADLLLDQGTGGECECPCKISTKVLRSKSVPRLYGSWIRIETVVFDSAINCCDALMHIVSRLWCDTYSHPPLKARDTRRVGMDDAKESPITPVMKENEFEIINCYIKLVAGILSTIGALFMATAMRKNGLNVRKQVGSRTTSRILFTLAISDFIFSTMGVATTILRLTDHDGTFLRSWSHHALILCVHWAFEIASFLWTATLSVYIISKKRREFKLKYAHIAIWVLTAVFWGLEVQSLESDAQSRK